MILTEFGETYTYGGVEYIVGANVIANEASEYFGLIGTITEIRDGEDKETENDTPDVYCKFNPPCLPADIKKLEATFSDLYQQTKTMEDISLDMVIMAPEMLFLPGNRRGKQPFKVYYVKTDWANGGETGGYIGGPYTDFLEAKYRFEDDLGDELYNGDLLWIWKSLPNFCEEFSDNSYEAYLDGEYGLNHYAISIEERMVTPSSSFDMQRASEYKAECQMEDFVSQIAEWDEVGRLTEEQYARMTADRSIAERIESALGMNDSYWESYWQTVSEVARDEVQKYLAENPPDEEPKPKKLWYTISFAAKMSDDDVWAMKNCFYGAMDESMGIEECAALDIELDDDQDDEEDEE